ncbi:MAG: LysM peptidoglycan-binding domain-containing protein [Chloroflexota bacterium]
MAPFRRPRTDLPAPPTDRPRWRRLRPADALIRLRRPRERWRPAYVSGLTVAAALTLWWQGERHVYASASALPRLAGQLVAGALERLPGSTATISASAWHAPPLTRELVPPSNSPGGDEAVDHQGDGPTEVEQSEAASPLSDSERGVDAQRAAGQALGRGAVPSTDEPLTSPMGEQPTESATDTADEPATESGPADAIPPAQPPVGHQPVKVPPPAPPRPSPTPRAMAIAAPLPNPATPHTHVVGARETLSSIARRYGTTVEAIAELNDLANPDRIGEGDRLLIPR